MGREWTRNNVIAADHVDHAVEFLRREFRNVLPVLAVFHFPVVFLYSFLINRAGVFAVLADSADGTALLKNILLLYAGILLSSVFDTYIKTLISGALIFAAWRRTAYGEKASLRDMLRSGGRLLLYVWLLGMLLQAAAGAVSGVFSALVFLLGGLVTLMEASPVLSVAVPVVLLLLLLAVTVVGVWLLARLSLIPQAVVIDRVNIFKAFGASWRATKGQVRHLIALFLAAVLTTLMVNTAVAALSAYSLFDGQVFTAVLSALISAVGSLGTYLWSLSSAFFYMRRRTELSDEDGYELALNEFFGKRGV